MIKHQINIRVMYADVDRMGVMHHAQYIKYYEMARTELLRHYGLSYKMIEDRGFEMPVTKLTVKYIRPAQYDELLSIETHLTSMKGPRIVFKYRVFGESSQLINQAETEQVFVNTNTRKPCATPGFIRAALGLVQDS